MTTKEKGDKKIELYEFTELREPMKWFAAHMERQLKINDSKGGWKVCNDAYLLKRLLEEVGELVFDIHNKHGIGSVIKEAADVANFAMMIADNRRKK